MKRGNINNCENCLHAYGQYDVNDEKDSDWEEWNCIIPLKLKNNEGVLEIKKPKGLCQFCNPKSKYYNK